MCGLIVLAGKQSYQCISTLTERLKHRGPDQQTIYRDTDFVMGFQRLAINGDAIEGRQPFEHQGWLSVVNGEIYNYRTLNRMYELGENNCDTAIVLPLYLKLNAQIIEVLDGFFAAVFVNPARTEAICLRDPMGKKPLFVGVSNGMTFITSELKSVDSIEWFKALPKGVSSVNLVTAEITTIQKAPSRVTQINVREALTQSVSKRLPAQGQPVGIFLSGGLDSSIIASIASTMRDDIVYFTLGDSKSQDLGAVRTVVNYLQLKNVIVVPLPSSDEIPDLISETVYTTESYNPSIISNGLATYLLARAAKELGIKVVLTGEGADELFGGYHQFSEHEPWQETRERLIQDMTFTELRRLDLACMAHGLEPRCPFLDSTVKAVSDGMGFSELYANGQNKAKLRAAFEGVLPHRVLYRKKISCDVGSGMRGVVVRYLKRNGRSEREELLAIWKQHFRFDHRSHYFHAYPVFDTVIDIRSETHK